MAVFRCDHCGGVNRLPTEQPVGKRVVCGRCKRALDVSGSPQNVDPKRLARLVASAPGPVLVDFWAPWCGPCKTLAPVLEQLGRTHAGELLVVKLNTEQHPGPSAAHNIRGIPTMILFQNGKEAARQTGALPPAALEQWYRKATAR